jgi:hypothetical protein
MSPVLNSLAADQSEWMAKLAAHLDPAGFSTLDSLRAINFSIREEARRLWWENVRLKARLEANQLTTV